MWLDLLLFCLAAALAGVGAMNPGFAPLWFALAAAFAVVALVDQVRQRRAPASTHAKLALFDANIDVRPIPKSRTVVLTPQVIFENTSDSSISVQIEVFQTLTDNLTMNAHPLVPVFLVPPGQRRFIEYPEFAAQASTVYSVGVTYTVTYGLVGHRPEGRKTGLLKIEVRPSASQRGAWDHKFYPLAESDQPIRRSRTWPWRRKAGGLA